MSFSTVIILIIIGLVIGVIGGLFGIGGAIFLIPALVFFVGLDQKTATGTSIAFMLPPIGALAVYNYHKAGYVNFKYAIILALAFMIGSYFSSKFALKISENTIRKIFALAIIIIGIKMFFTK